MHTWLVSFNGQIILFINFAKLIVKPYLSMQLVTLVSELTYSVMYLFEIYPVLKPNMTVNKIKNPWSHLVIIEAQLGR